MFIDISSHDQKGNRLGENKDGDKDKYLVIAAKYLKVHYMVMFGLFFFVAASYGIRHYCMHTAGIFMF